MNVSGIGNGTYDRWSSVGGHQASPEVLAAQAAQRAENQAALSRERALEETRRLVGSFIAARDAHEHYVRVYSQAQAKVEKTKAEAERRPDGFIDSLVWGFLAVIGFSPTDSYHRAIRDELRARNELERLRRERATAFSRAETSALTWSGQYRWEILEEEGWQRC